MTDKEKFQSLLAEIERLKEEFTPLTKGSDYLHGYEEFYSRLKKHIRILEEDDKCNGCNNVKGCIICEDGEQWAHIEEIKHPEDAPCNEEFAKAFKEYERENPDWLECITDSTYYDLADWYDAKQGEFNPDDCSDEAREFADYVWEKYVEKADTPTQKHVFTLKGEVCDFPTGGDDYELYLKYDDREMDVILDKITDIVNEDYPDDEDRYNVTIQITIDKENI